MLGKIVLYSTIYIQNIYYIYTICVNIYIYLQCVSINLSKYLVFMLVFIVGCVIISFSNLGFVGLAQLPTLGCAESHHHNKIRRLLG